MSDPVLKTIEFPAWPIWNFQFPELDVMLVHAVKYFDEQGQVQSLPQDFWRLAIGRNGVSMLASCARTTSRRCKPITRSRCRWSMNRERKLISTGDKELDAALAAFDKNVQRKAVATALKNSINLFAKRIYQARVPVLSGAMRDAVVVRVPRGTKRGELRRSLMITCDSLARARVKIAKATEARDPARPSHAWPQSVTASAAASPRPASLLGVANSSQRPAPKTTSTRPSSNLETTISRRSVPCVVR